ncbi:MAG: helix-turn-helix domain-containing protein [Spirochaetia bacterium]|nr:helix-turn-helix domain-containing protein [Spirochaetia bacterium]
MVKIPDLEAFYTPTETSEMLEAHKNTVRRWIKEGKLKASRKGKTYWIEGKEIQRFMRGES